MAAPKPLKESHPQKYYLQFVCKCIYCLGIGDCWYEHTIRSKTHKILYGIWAAVFNSYIILMTLSQLLAHARSDLTLKEKNDLWQFSFAHTSLCAKYIILFLQKNRVKMICERLIEGTRPIFSSPKVDKESVRKAILYVATLSFMTYGTLAFTTLDAIMVYYKEGIPLRTEVTFYPSRMDTSISATVMRFFSQLHWWCIVTNMCFVDGLSIFALVFLGYKFKVVRLYFESLRYKVKRNLRNQPDAALVEDFKKDFIVGIQLHEDALWCARNVQFALGNIYSVQVCESITLLVLCLIKLVASSTERNMWFILANVGYIMCMLIMTGAYFCAAGDITHEAGELSTSIFYSGWDMVRARKELRSLAVVSIQRSQVPVCMTAFGIVTLSYANLIAVVRSSYSFFAVMY